MAKKGIFIVIEGSDGSGKATQLQLLVKRIKKETKRKIVVFDFPRYQTFFGKLVGKYLAGDFGGIKEVSPYLTSLTYALDRWSAKEKLKKYIASGKVVVSNRYYLSSMAHQTARMAPNKRKEFMKFLEELELKQFGIPKDNLTVYLRVSPNIAQKLVDKKAKRNYLKNKKRDIHEGNIQHLIDSTKIYDLLTKTHPRIKRIDCDDKNGEIKSIENIHELVWKVVKGVI